MPFREYETIKNIILSICDLPAPSLFLLKNNNINRIHGTTFHQLNDLMIKNLICEKTGIVDLHHSEALKEQGILFCLSIKFDEQVLILLSSSNKSLNTFQLRSLAELGDYFNLIKKKNELELDAERYSKGIATLNDLSENTYLSIEEKIHECLKMAVKHFNMEGGIMSSIRTETYIVQDFFPHDIGFQKGQEIPLNETYCDIPHKLGQSFAIEDMGKSIYAKHPCYSKFKQESYIGTTFKSDLSSGSISFSSTQKKEQAFSRFDMEFIEMIGKWVSTLLIQKERERKYKYEQNLLGSFVRAAPAAIAMLNTKLEYITASQKWYKDYNIERNIIGISHFDVFPDIEQHWKNILLRCLAGEIISKEEEEFKTADGSLQYLRWSVNPWYNDEHQIGGILMFTEDITDLVNHRKQIEEINYNLEKSAKIKDQFAYIASHDLQQPVTNINNLSSVLLKEYAGKLDQEFENILQFIFTNSIRMTTLINGLLEYSRLGRENKVYEISAQKLVEEILIDLKQPLEECRAHVKVDKLPMVYGYEAELRIIFQNLIENALKFRSLDRDLKISIQSGEEENHWLFAVSDNGIGIPDKYKEKIFQIFQRLHDRSKYEGEGVGLAHCERAVEVHLGKIWAEDNTPEGTKFIFTIGKGLEGIGSFENHKDHIKVNV